MLKPYISIIVPAFNESAVLANCLSSLLSQDHARPFEIIVVDNGSTDDTARIAQKYHVRMVAEPRKGVCFARQAGLTAARGEVILSTDADCHYPSGWLARIEESFLVQTDLALLVGTYRFSPAPVLNRFLSSYEQLALRLHYSYGWQLYVSAANLAYRRHLFTGYDTSLHSGGDELYVLSQIRQRGRVGFDISNPVITSPRRLRGRFFATLIHDFGAKYLGAYVFRRFSAVRRSEVVDVRDNRRPSMQLPYTVIGIVMLITMLGLLVLMARGVNDFIALIPVTPLNTMSIVALILGVGAYCTFWPTSQLIVPAPWRVWSQEKIVALTFDDGPNAPYTIQIAEIIESYGGQATFFQCGQLVNETPAVTARLSKAGHTIGNHTYDHSFWKLWRPRLLLESIETTTTAINKCTNQPVKFFRSPWLTKTPVTRWAIRRAGLMAIAGQFISLREPVQPDGRSMARRALRRIRPGSIIILHDSREIHRGNRAQTVIAVKTLCQALAADGFRFVSLDELYLAPKFGSQARGRK